MDPASCKTGLCEVHQNAFLEGVGLSVNIASLIKLQQQHSNNNKSHIWSYRQACFTTTFRREL